MTGFAPGVTAVDIPRETAYTVRQTTRQEVHTERCREYIGNVTFVNDPVGTPVVARWDINPILMPGTRLRRIASNYQKFRFRQLALTIQSATTTATNGLYVVGYNNNPDSNPPPGFEVNYAFDLPGAQSANIWRTITSIAKIEDRQKWFNVDPDSNEVMNTTQGYFVVVQQTAISTTAPITMPCILDYVVEFSGSSLNPLSTNTPVIFPQGIFTYNSVTGNYTFTADSSDSTPIPSLTNGQPYEFIPAQITPIGVPPNERDQTIRVLVPTLVSYTFYETLKDYDDSKPINTLGSTIYVYRSSLLPIAQ